MGGAVGLKGTDGGMYERALALGATPVTPVRIQQVLSLVTRRDLHFLAAPGRMGEVHLKGFPFHYEVVGESREKTTSQDTKSILTRMRAMGVALVIFVGGDGTARDVLDVLGTEIPVIGIPSGVKMFSSVFALSPHAAAAMINSFGEDFIEKEVLDIDEEAFRENRLVSKLYGYVRVPDFDKLLQGKKEASDVSSRGVDKKAEVAAYVLEHMEKGVVYLLGPGTTLKSIADGLGVAKTLLGVDAYHDGTLIGEDVNEAAILEILQEFPRVKVIITPIGGNGFIFGRGSRQLSARVLGRLAKEDILVVSTLDKVGGLRVLRVDSGDTAVDERFKGAMPVLVGYGEEIMMEVAI
jgi:predicted polyphosphate/ATP-dependent NAD kinase